MRIVASRCSSIGWIHQRIFRHFTDTAKAIILCIIVLCPPTNAAENLEPLTDIVEPALNKTEGNFC